MSDLDYLQTQHSIDMLTEHTVDMHLGVRGVSGVRAVEAPPQEKEPSDIVVNAAVISIYVAWAVFAISNLIS